MEEVDKQIEMLTKNINSIRDELNKELLTTFNVPSSHLIAGSLTDKDKDSDELKKISTVVKDMKKFIDTTSYKLSILSSVILGLQTDLNAYNRATCKHEFHINNAFYSPDDVSSSLKICNKCGSVEF
jgi:hypothetical protein